METYQVHIGRVTSQAAWGLTLHPDADLPHPDVDMNPGHSATLTKQFPLAFNIFKLGDICTLAVRFGGIVMVMIHLNRHLFYSHRPLFL